VGTVLFALTVGPNVHWFLDRMTLAEPRRRRPRDDDEGPLPAIESL
jgi:uncharacterized membrane protein YczE